MKKDEKKTPSQLLSIGQVSKRSGVPISTLHFYETKGLITSQRNSGNQRRYPRHILRQLAVIRVAQGLGISLSDIREHIDKLPHNAPATATDWERMSSIWAKDLDERIARLTTLKNKLSVCIGCGCLSIDDCPLRNPDDRAAEFCSGAPSLDTATDDETTTIPQ
ncbi:MAG: redox-sensitive transcriptional activator SoxR [Pseudomonadales bacterium]|nr:redox-sensitive transcriptional activator SoxR [Pseudomonadales bacterium]